MSLRNGGQREIVEWCGEASPHGMCNVDVGMDYSGVFDDTVVSVAFVLLGPIIVQEEHDCKLSRLEQKRLGQRQAHFDADKLRW